MNIKFEKPLFNKGEFLLFNCLIRAFIIFITVCGTIEAVMSCFNIYYDRNFVFCILFLCAILFTVLDYIKIIKIIAYAAFVYYYIKLIIIKKEEIKSALYSMANSGYEIIRNKFQFPSVEGFPEIITDRDFAITQLVIIGGILFVFVASVIVSDFMSIIFTFIITFILIQVGLIFDANPNLLSVIMISLSWILIIIFDFNGRFRISIKKVKIIKRKKKNYFKQKTNGLVMFNMAMVSSIIFIISVFSANDIYNRQPLKLSFKPTELKNDVDMYIKNNMIVLFSKFKKNNITYSISGGQLGSYSSIPLSESKKLTVDFVPYTKDIIYLKSYIGTDYNNNSWQNTDGKEKNQLNVSDFTYNLLENNFNSNENEKERLMKEKEEELILKQEELKRQAMLGEAVNLEDYQQNTDIETEENKKLFSSFKLKMRIKNINGVSKYAYFPYYSSENNNNISNYLSDDYYTADFQKENSYDIIFYPYDKNNMGEIKADTSKYDRYIKNKYLKIPNENKDEIEKLCYEKGFKNNDELIDKIKNYFKEEFIYTSNPGMVPWRTDFVNYFLFENKKGHCAHFASAATLIFRSLGIPARYVEGYVINPKDVSEAEKIENENVDEWIWGIDDTKDLNVVRVDINDYCVYSWVEIYKEGFGWITADVSPVDENTIDNLKNQDIENTRLDDIVGMLSLKDNIIEKADKENKENKSLNNTAFNINNFFIAVATVIFMTIFIIKFRIRIHFFIGDYKKRLNYKFIYLTKIMKILGIDFNNMSYRQFTDNINNYFGFDDNKASYISDIIQKGYYSPYGVTKSEYQRCNLIINDIKRLLYKKAGIKKYIIIKLIV